MSQVISFRLNPDNPREAQALEILRSKQAEGFSSRRVLTDALISMAASKEKDTVFFIDEFNVALEQISDLLERMNSGNQGYKNTLSTNTQLVTLNDKFLNSVKVSAKPGLNIE